jgi:hypothetical protein
MNEDVQERTHDNSTAALTWRLDALQFNEALIEVLRKRDTVLPRVAMDEISRDLIELITDWEDGKQNDLTKMLDRLAVLGAASLRFNQQWLFDSFVRTSLNIYLSGFEELRDRRRQTATKGIPEAVLWLNVVIRIFAVGAYAVRLEEWGAVRKLALQTFPEFPHRSAGDEEHWLRHATIRAAWGKLLDSSGPQLVKGGELISFAQRLIDVEPGLRPDLPQRDERLVDSIAQFDLLVLLVVSAKLGTYDTSHVYPSMAAWGLRRSEPVILKVLSDNEVLNELFCGKFDEKLLGHCLKEAQRYAYQLDFSHEMGWSSSQVRSLLSEISNSG